MNRICKEPITEVAIDITDIQYTNIEKENDKCIFFVACRMIYRKGIDFLLDALTKIPENLNYQVRIVGDGPELSHLQKRCKKMVIYLNMCILQEQFHIQRWNVNI